MSLTITARSVVTGALRALGVADGTSPPSAEDMATGYAALRELVDNWSLQGLTSVMQDRTVYDLVANRQIYTIGPSTSSPQLSTGTAARPIEIAAAGLLLNSGVSAVVTAGGTGYAVADVLTVVGGTKTTAATFRVTAVSSGVVTAVTVTNSGQYSVFPSNPVATTVVPAGGSGCTLTVTWTGVGPAQPVEIPLAILTDQMWQSISIKDLSNPLPTSLYYAPTDPLGEITLWPIPNTAVNDLVIYTDLLVAQFTSLSADYVCAPGYAKALRFNLAKVLVSDFAVPELVEQRVTRQADQSLSDIKYTNVQMSDLELDPGFTDDARGGYNIWTD